MGIHSLASRYHFKAHGATKRLKNNKHINYLKQIFVDHIFNLMVIVFMDYHLFFRTTIMLRVSFSPVPNCVVILLLEPSFSEPLVPPEPCCYCCCRVEPGWLVLLLCQIKLCQITIRQVTLSQITSCQITFC